MRRSLANTRLRFEDDALEGAFLAEHAREAAPVCRSMLLVGVVLTLAYLPFYQLLWPDYFPRMAALILAGSTPTLLICLLLTYLPAVQRRIDAFICSMLVVYLTAWFVPIFVLGPPDIARVVFYLWLQFPPFLLLFRVRFLPGLIASPALIGLVPLTAWLVEGEPAHAALSVVVMVGVTAVSLVGLYQLERSRRQAFAFAFALGLEKEEASGLLLGISRYLPQGLLEKVRSERGQPRLGGESREITVYFSDLRGYSTISERLDPAQVLGVLNEYFAAMNMLIEAHGGTVLEYIGDGIMAVFNAPNELPDHASAAVACARETQQVMRRLNAEWEARGLATLWQQQGVDDISVRIGLHSGEVVVGNIGGPDQMKYGVVGDVVNVAARLEALNKQLGTSILMSGETARRLPPALVAILTPKGEHALKGRREMMAVHTVSS